MADTATPSFKSVCRLRTFVTGVPFTGLHARTDAITSAAVLLYISYVLPTAIGAVAYGRWWTGMGPWHLGRWFRPLAVVSVVGCAALVAIGMQPPNEKAVYVVGGMVDEHQVGHGPKPTRSRRSGSR